MAWFENISIVAAIVGAALTFASTVDYLGGRTSTSTARLPTSRLEVFLFYFFLLLQQIMLFTLSFPLSSCSQQQKQQYNSSTFHLHIAIREVITIISFKVDFPK